MGRVYNASLGAVKFSEFSPDFGGSGYGRGYAGYDALDRGTAALVEAHATGQGSEARTRSAEAETLDHLDEQTYTRLD